MTTPQPEQTIVIPVGHEADIVEVRQTVRHLAKEHGFDSFAASALTTVASELTRNIWTYARRGEVTIAVLRWAGRTGLELDFRDQGPGIEDVARVLRGGYSTGGSLGMGVAGSRRLVDEFTIDSAPGRGTRITVRKWKPTR